MEARGISLACCAVLALALGACSGDSQPTGPEMGGSPLNREYEVSYDASGSSGGSSTSDGSQTDDGSATWQGSAADGSDAPQPGSADGEKSVMTYPIGHFLTSQGSFCADDGMGGCAYYMSPTGNYLGFANRSLNMIAAVDYAGIANAWLAGRGQSVGTFIDGSVTEEPLADGTARVTVQLNGANVMAYVVRGADFSGELMFGQTTMGMLSGTEKPALGHVRMTITFINTHPGAPLPDLMQLVRAPQFGQRLESLSLVYNGDGVMHPHGEQRQVQITYDGSGGPIMSYHPDAPSTSTAVGRGDILFSSVAEF